MVGEGSDFEVQSAVRELKKAGHIDEMPNGEGILMEPDSNRELQVDFEYLSQLKVGKYQKLQQMETYAQTEQCFHRFILEYFGDETEMEACPGCGNCSKDDGITEKLNATDPLTAEQQVTVQKVLSCVYRLKGRYGISVVAQVLTGSRNKKLLEWGLDKLSTYHIIQEYKQDEVKRIIEATLMAGYLKQTADQYPVIAITEEGVEAANHPEHLRLRWPLASKGVTSRDERDHTTSSSKGKTGGKGQSDFEYDTDLFEVLRSLRLEIAREEKVAPFVIFHDRTLKEMARFKPVNREQLLQIWGVGDRSYVRYGERFLRSIQSSIETQPY
jgi:ATP-dependent DNA helicase RecQ